MCVTVLVGLGCGLLGVVVDVSLIPVVQLSLLVKVTVLLFELVSIRNLRSVPLLTVFELVCIVWKCSFNWSKTCEQALNTPWHLCLR